MFEERDDEDNSVWWIDTSPSRTKSHSQERRAIPLHRYRVISLARDSEVHSCGSSTGLSRKSSSVSNAVERLCSSSGLSAVASLVRQQQTRASVTLRATCSASSGARFCSRTQCDAAVPCQFVESQCPVVLRLEVAVRRRAFAAGRA